MHSLQRVYPHNSALAAVERPFLQQLPYPRQLLCREREAGQQLGQVPFQLFVLRKLCQLQQVLPVRVQPLRVLARNFFGCIGCAHYHQPVGVAQQLQKA